MHTIRNRMSRQLLTSTTDSRHAEQLVAGFEQLRVTRDLNAQHHYWHISVMRFGQKHPYDLEAAAALAAERDRLTAYWLAGGNH